MHARKELEKRIEKEQRRIIDLQMEIAKLESFVQGLNEALKMLPKDDDEFTIKRKGSGTFRPGSEIARIQELINQKGKPLHISEIVTGLGKADTKANRTSLTGSLGKYVRKGQVFCRTGPNMFGLIGMQAEKNLQLPPEFGSEEIKDDLPF